MIGLLKSSIFNPTKCSFYGMDKDEEILLLLRRDLITNLGWVIITLLLVFTPFVAGTIFNSLGVDPLRQLPIGLLIVLTLFWYIFAFGYLFVNFLNWFFNVHLVTNKRVVDMDFSGILYRNIADAPLNTIQDVTHTISGAAEILFNYGTVYIQTAGEQRELEFAGIPEPARIQDYISDLVAQRVRRGGRV
jgi:membrane protein YdbS with pleckstrin-like domain